MRCSEFQGSVQCKGSCGATLCPNLVAPAYTHKTLAYMTAPCIVPNDATLLPGTLKACLYVFSQYVRSYWVGTQYTRRNRKMGKQWSTNLASRIVGCRLAISAGQDVGRHTASDPRRRLSHWYSSELADLLHAYKLRVTAMAFEAEFLG